MHPFALSRADDPAKAIAAHAVTLSSPSSPAVLTLSGS
jgi:hypothetical protein